MDFFVIYTSRKANFELVIVVKLCQQIYFFFFFFSFFFLFFYSFFAKPLRIDFSGPIQLTDSDSWSNYQNQVNLSHYHLSHFFFFFFFFLFFFSFSTLFSKALQTDFSDTIQLIDSELPKSSHYHLFLESLFDTFIVLLNCP